MKQADRYAAVLERFEHEMPSPATELHYDNPFQLLVAVILSAQCTDKRVNMVTPKLFEAFPDAKSLANADPEAVYALIRSVSYPNNKTRSLIGMAKRLTEVYDGEVPHDIDDLMSLPGVGRKTANVVLAVIFNQPAMPVDTHVFRVANRIGLTVNSRTPLSTEKSLTSHIAPEVLGKAHHWLILHGRYVCKARSPQCRQCYLADVCRSSKRLIEAADKAAEAKKSSAKKKSKK